MNPKSIMAFLLLWAVFLMLGLLAVDAANRQYNKAERKQIGEMRTEMANRYCEVAG